MCIRDSAYDDQGRVILYIGAENWPVPIPLVKKNGGWVFDTAGGTEELLFRRIGRNELFTICLLYTSRGSIKNNEQRIRLYRMVEFIGRWSMVDVFVDTFTAALIQLQPLMSVEPGPGLFFFAAVVVLTMLAVESFDPRLIWDATSSKEVVHA